SEVNDAPTANPDTATVAEDGSVAIDAAANDSEIGRASCRESVHVSDVDAPSHGSTSIISSGPDQGKVLYTPDANYNGPDSFTYTATDNGTTNGAAAPKSNTGTVTVTVSEVNDAPTANPDTATVAEDGSVAIDAAANDS